MESKSILAAVVIFILGASSGYYFTPTKTVIVEKVVEKKAVDRDIVTKTTTKVDKSGNPVTKTVTVDKSKEKSTTVADKSTTVSRLNKDWLVSAGYGVSIKDVSDREIIGSLQRRILGDLYVGILGSSKGTVGLGVTFRF